MGFWSLRKKNETDEDKAARHAARAQRDVITYDAIMSAFVQPLPTFSQWAAPVPRGHPPSYENAAQSHYPASYYPNQSYENPYGYSPCPSSNGSEILPTYVDSTYNPYSRQVCFFPRSPPPSIGNCLTQQG